MQRTIVWTLYLVGALMVFSCRGSEPDTQDPQEQQADVQDIRCTPAGHWRIQEQRVGGSCVPDRVPGQSIVLDVEELEMTEQGQLWRFELTRGDEPLETCSGVPSDDRCAVELTCSGGMGEEEAQYALTLELSPSGSLSGSGVLTLRSPEGDECQAELTLEGEQVSPAELERSE